MGCFLIAAGEAGNSLSGYVQQIHGLTDRSKWMWNRFMGWRKLDNKQSPWNFHGVCTGHTREVSWLWKCSWCWKRASWIRLNNGKLSNGTRVLCDVGNLKDRYLRKQCCCNLVFGAVFVWALYTCLVEVLFLMVVSKLKASMHGEVLWCTETKQNTMQNPTTKCPDRFLYYQSSNLDWKGGILSWVHLLIEVDILEWVCSLMNMDFPPPGEIYLPI